MTPPRRIGILHPGQMGSVVAATIQSSGNEVWWASEGRRRQTCERASELGLVDAGAIEKLCDVCSVIVSVCPPEFADAVANQVLQYSFRGLYVDANAISPERVRRMDARMRAAGIRFVDGGIIGPAVRTPGKTWIFLSGDDAEEAASCFTAGPIHAEVVDGGVGKASALKMCYAAYSKGNWALICAVAGAAEQLGVRDVLEKHWARSSAASPDVTKTFRAVAPKAWRFAAEMQEIARTFEAAGMPAGFHQAAEQVYSRLESFKDGGDPDYDEVLRALAPAQNCGADLPVRDRPPGRSAGPGGPARTRRSALPLMPEEA